MIFINILVTQCILDTFYILSSSVYLGNVMSIIIIPLFIFTINFLQLYLKRRHSRIFLVQHMMSISQRYGDGSKEKNFYCKVICKIIIDEIKILQFYFLIFISRRTSILPFNIINLFSVSSLFK